MKNALNCELFALKGKILTLGIPQLPQIAKEMNMPSTLRAQEQKPWRVPLALLRDQISEGWILRAQELHQIVILLMGCLENALSK